MYILCAGHTLNLSIEAALKERTLSSAIATCRKVVTHLNKSRVNVIVYATAFRHTNILNMYQQDGILLMT